MAHCPGSAYPSYVQDHYSRDNAFYQRWDAIARDRETFRAWMDEHVLGCRDHAAFLARLRATHERLDPRRDDDDRGRAAAVGRLRLFRRHQAAERSLQLARLTHAPGIVLIYESGTLGTRPGVLPLSIGDGELAETAACVIALPEVFAYLLQAGRVDVGFLGAAQLDRHGNLNSTVIGPYEAPSTRLPGAGRDRDRGARPTHLRDAQGDAAQPRGATRLPHQRRFPRRARAGLAPPMRGGARKR